MDTTNFSPVASSVAAPAEIDHRLRRRPKWSWIILGLLAMAGIIILIGSLLQENAPTEGFLDRTNPDLAGLDTPVATNGTCFSRYRVAPAGRDEKGTQHYALTIELTDDAVDEAALARILSERSCEEEASTILDAVSDRLGRSLESGALTTVYASPHGRLFVGF